MPLQQPRGSRTGFQQTPMLNSSAGIMSVQHLNQGRQVYFIGAISNTSLLPNCINIKHYTLVQVVESSSLFSVLFREAFSHPYISFFHSLVSVSVLFRRPLPFLILVGVISGQGGIKMVSASTPSANEPAKDLSLVHTLQLMV